VCLSIAVSQRGDRFEGPFLLLLHRKAAENDVRNSRCIRRLSGRDRAGRTDYLLQGGIRR